MVQSFDHVHFYYTWLGIWWEMFWLTQFLLTTVLENENKLLQYWFSSKVKTMQEGKSIFLCISIISDKSVFPFLFIYFCLIQIKFTRQLLNLTILLFKVYHLFLIILSLIKSIEYPLAGTYAFFHFELLNFLKNHDFELFWKRSNIPFFRKRPYWLFGRSMFLLK